MSSPSPGGLRPTLADALLLFTVAVWGVNYSVVKVALAELPPLAFNSVRFAAATALLAAVTFATGRRWRFARRHLPFLIALGLAGNAVYQLLFIYGVAQTSANNTALILSTVPAWVALAGTLAGMEQVRPLGWLGVGLSLAGITLIILGADRAATFRFGGPSLRGDALLLVSTLLWSACTLLMRLAVRYYGPMTVTSFCTVVGGVPLIFAGVPQLAALDLGAVSPAVWIAAVFSGALAIGLSYFFWNYGVAQLGSARTSLYSNLTPAFALVTAWLFLGETLTAAQASGAVLAVAGVLLARRHTQPREPAPKRVPPSTIAPR